MRDLLIALIVFASVPMAFVRPYVGVLMWYWLSLMNPHRLTWGFAYHMPVAILSGGATLAAWMLSREPKVPPSSPPVYFLAAFTIWVSICTVFAIQPEYAFIKWEQAIKILGFTFVTMCLMQSRHRIHLLVWTIALSIGFYGVRGGVFGILTGGQYRVFGPPASFIGDNNQLALALVMVLPLMRYLQLTTETRWIRLGLWGAAGLTVIAIVATYSRGGFLALTITMFFLWLKSKYRMITMLASVVAMAGVLTFMPARWFDRIESIGDYKEDQSAQGRFDAWTFAFRLAQERPIVGGGFSVFADSELFMRLVPDARMARNAHSIYFEVLGENGFVGLGLFLALGLASLLTARATQKLARQRPDLGWAESLARMLQVSLIGYATAGAFLNLGFFDLYYVLIAVIVVLHALVRRELATTERPEKQPPKLGPRAAAPAPLR